MVTVKGETKKIHDVGANPDPAPLTYYHEGPWIFKREGLYYFTYPGRANSPNNADRMCYATATSIHGPWTYRGYFLDTTDCDTSHGSVVEYKDHWYVFYHNRNLSGQLNLRSIAVDEIFFNADGTIKLVQQTTTGPEAIGPRTKPSSDCVTYEAEESQLFGLASVLETDKVESGKVVQGLQPLETGLTFNNVSGGEKDGRALLRFRYASDGKAKWNLTVNGADWSSINLMSSGGVNFYSGYVDFTVPIEAGGNNIVSINCITGRVFLDCMEVYLLDGSDETDLLGDVNNDGKINIFDIMKIRDHIFGKITLEDRDYWTANVDGSESINIFDIMTIRDHIFGKRLIG